MLPLPLSLSLIIHLLLALPKLPIQYPPAHLLRKQVWEPRVRSTNAEGKPSYSDELVPKHGTRSQFMRELLAALEVYLPHFWDQVLMQRGIKVHEALIYSTTATIRSDYAAQIKTIRVYNATCASPETHNLCVTVVGCQPYDEMVELKKHGKRPASSRRVRKSRRSVYSSAFTPPVTSRVLAHSMCCVKMCHFC